MKFLNPVFPIVTYAYFKFHLINRKFYVKYLSRIIFGKAKTYEKNK